MRRRGNVASRGSRGNTTLVDQHRRDVHEVTRKDRPGACARRIRCCASEHGKSNSHSEYADTQANPDLGQGIEKRGHHEIESTTRTDQNGHLHRERSHYGENAALRLWHWLEKAYYPFHEREGDIYFRSSFQQQRLRHSDPISFLER